MIVMTVQMYSLANAWDTFFLKVENALMNETVTRRWFYACFCTSFQFTLDLFMKETEAYKLQANTPLKHPLSTAQKT